MPGRRDGIAKRSSVVSRNGNGDRVPIVGIGPRASPVVGPGRIELRRWSVERQADRVDVKSGVIAIHEDFINAGTIEGTGAAVGDQPGAAGPLFVLVRNRGGSEYDAHIMQRVGR